MDCAQSLILPQYASRHLGPSCSLHMMLQAWNECETAGNNYLNTYATLSSDDEDMAEDPSSTEGTSAKLSSGDLSTALNLVQHPLVHAEQLLLKVSRRQ